MSIVSDLLVKLGEVLREKNLLFRKVSLSTVIIAFAGSPVFKP